MKKADSDLIDEMRPEYQRSDFSGPLVRGKYSRRLKQESNIVVLKPEVAAAFPYEDAVNSVLLSLIKIAKSTVPVARRRARRKNSQKSD